MIYEYALEPEMVATWGERQNYRFFMREFGIGKGRIVSRYPKPWLKHVWKAYHGDNEMDKKRLEEIILCLKETMIKRKNCIWDESKNSWIENALLEHNKHPFKAILARKNPDNKEEIICESDFDSPQCIKWDNPHGITVNRNVAEMTGAIEMLLKCCRWIKFIDPYFVQAKAGSKDSMREFLHQLALERSVGPLEKVEIHTGGDGATIDFLKQFYGPIIPPGMTVTIYQWQNIPESLKLHNRYILTDLGGVSFNHGLDSGKAGERDDLNRLDLAQYRAHCREYDSQSPAFDLAEAPLKIIGG